MDKIIDSITLYTVENGMLTWCVSLPSPSFPSPPLLLTEGGLASRRLFL